MSGSEDLIPISESQIIDYHLNIHPWSVLVNGMQNSLGFGPWVAGQKPKMNVWLDKNRYQGKDPCIDLYSAITDNTPINVQRLQEIHIHLNDYGTEQNRNCWEGREPKPELPQKSAFRTEIIGPIITPTRSVLRITSNSHAKKGLLT